MGKEQHDNLRNRDISLAEGQLNSQRVWITMADLFY